MAQRVVYNKLVRDNIPAIIESEGKLYDVMGLDEASYRVALCAKLIEEANEVATSETRATMLQELSDVLEVLEALCDSLSISSENLQTAKAQRKNERGGFGRQLMLLWVEEPDEVLTELSSTFKDHSGDPHDNA